MAGACFDVVSICGSQGAMTHAAKDFGVGVSHLYDYKSCALTFKLVLALRAFLGQILAPERHGYSQQPRIQLGHGLSRQRRRI